MAALLTTNRYPAPADGPLIRVPLSTPTNVPEAWNISAVSPDGERVVFGGAFILGTGNQLWVRSFDTGEARLLAGTGGATGLFWSPDGRTIAFFS